MIDVFPTPMSPRSITFAFNIAVAFTPKSDVTIALDHEPGKSVNGTETVRDQIAIPKVANADRWRKFRDIFGLRHYL
ncbi:MULTISPECIES: hypothetical protein [unclassified Bradyrhizobium]|uniref:hypothetical protein n=1 Tax=unclassified Bradyrhizobium TaxID=2631580 RepID=UPI0028E57CB8|nr:MULTISPECIES: hypothetical protein [unclassified Bradyrhizobium]